MEKITHISLPGPQAPLITRSPSIRWMFAFIFISAFLSFPRNSAAVIYRYYDADGSIHFTDTPGHGEVEVAKDSKASASAGRVFLKKTGGKHGTASFCRDEGNPQIEGVIRSMCQKYGVDPSLVKAVIGAESGFDRMAVSPKGAMGLMQLMPGTALSLGVFDPFDAGQNIEGGVKYLSNLLERFGGNVTLAVAAYNAGPGAILKYGTVPPYQETGTYVKKILASYSGAGAPVHERKGPSSFISRKHKKKKTSFAPKKNTIIYRVTLNDGTVLYTNNPTGF